ncbi:MAG: hypothetical protein OXU20_39370 [Myxococcales bacterium]|nr:hypothetical protein [Myxococcales bacterium]MDD9965094.1 hypothetical protein [Myxococcales bacterium]
MVTRQRPLNLLVAALAVALSALAAGCLERELKPLNPCLVSGVIAEIAVQNVDKVDLLFVVDDSNSMQEEQASLRREFPTLVRTLTTGVRSDGSTFSPAKDLHLGVVSTDLGLPRVNDVRGCIGFGQDGIMNKTPSGEGCPTTDYDTRFLSYVMDAGSSPEQIAADFGCIASLGTEGCGYEQQLEAGLKALWPEVDIDPVTGAQWVDPMTMTPSNRITFLGDGTGEGTTGHGDKENAGFIRNSQAEGLSLIAIVLVTDEEDCSSSTTDHFVPQRSLPPGSKYEGQGQNLRCFFNANTNLYQVSRYVDGYKALRPEAYKNLVIFAAIAGVPKDLVEPEDIENIYEDEDARAAFYGTILGDPRMVEEIDPTTQADNNIDTDNLTPSCVGDGSANSKAYPPRRIVQVAQGFGSNGIVQSICQENFEPAVNAIIEIIAKQLGAVCLPRQLVRDSSGKVGCNVVWELPLPGAGAPVGTPTTCDQEGFLREPDQGEAVATEAGNARCVVQQLAVQGNQPEGGSGWFYDDFTEETTQECPADNPQRIAFTSDAQPPTGVTVQLECLSEVQRIDTDRDDIAAGLTMNIPSIGTPCENSETGDPDNSKCEIPLSDGSRDSSMFCHPEQNICVLECASNNDCPAAWVCDFRELNADTSQTGGKAICVNPTCGSRD